MFKKTDDFNNLPENISNSTGGSRLKFYIKAGDLDHRIIFLDGKFIGLYEHSQYDINKSMDQLPCIKNNSLGDECPFCDAGKYAKYTGYFDIIACGKVKFEKGKEIILPLFTTKKGEEVQCQMKLLGAQKGSEKKNGLLMILQKLREKRGDLKFTMWDISRAGENDVSTGSALEFVKKFESLEEIQDYLDEIGAPDDFEIKPIDFEKDYVKIYSVQQMNNILRAGAKGSRTVTKSGNQSSGQAEASVDDDDIPF